MGSVTIRTGLTSQGTLSMSPWKGDYSSYDYSTIGKGNNPISNLEVVSALNSFNIAHYQYHYFYVNCPQKYNPKIYLGSIQNVSRDWNLEAQSGQNWEQKSGSWPIIFEKNLLHFQYIINVPLL